MKDILKLITVFVVGVVAAAIPLSCFYFVWSWCMSQIPMTYAWSGLAKIGITLLMIAAGGSLTFAVTIFATAFAVTLTAAMLD